MKDKLLCLPAVGQKGWLSAELGEDMFDELPLLAAWLLDYKIPTDLKDSRFGLQFYIDPAVQAIQYTASNISTFEDVLLNHFVQRFALTKQTDYHMTPRLLWKQLIASQDGAQIMRTYPYHNYIRLLKKIPREHSWVKITCQGNQVRKISTTISKIKEFLNAMGEQDYFDTIQAEAPSMDALE